MVQPISASWEPPTSPVNGPESVQCKAVMVRGVCEGLANAARHCFESSGLTGKVYVYGGGSRSQGWPQIFASVLNRPLLLARAGEVGARGAAPTSPLPGSSQPPPTPPAAPTPSWEGHRCPPDLRREARHAAGRGHIRHARLPDQLRHREHPLIRQQYRHSRVHGVHLSAYRATPDRTSRHLRQPPGRIGLGPLRPRGRNSVDPLPPEVPAQHHPWAWACWPPVSRSS